ncbi:uncharacterized protein ACIBXB_009529 isoform 3-T3 [Morphnus guianensis]
MAAWVLSPRRMRSVGHGCWGGRGACRAARGAAVITVGAVPGQREQTVQASGMSQASTSWAAWPRGSGMGSSSPQHLLRVLCILSVLAGRLPPTTAQWFYPLGLEDTTPDPGTSPTAPTASTLDGEEDGDARSMEPTRKVLLSKPPLVTTPRRRDPLARGTAKGPGHAPLRTRGQVPFPGSIPPCSPSPPKTPQPLPGPSPRPSPYLCPAHTAAPARAGQRALLQPPATAQPPLPPWKGAVAAPGVHPMAELGLSPHPRLREGPACPPGSPQPRTELSPSVLAAPTHGHPRDLRGERGGRGVPADQDGSEGAAPAGAPSPGGRPCSPDAQRLRLRLPRASRPSRPKGRERRPRVPGRERPAWIPWGERKVRQLRAARSPGAPGSTGTAGAPGATRRLGSQEPTRARRPPRGIGERGESQGEGHREAMPGWVGDAGAGSCVHPRLDWQGWGGLGCVAVGVGSPEEGDQGMGRSYSPTLLSLSSLPPIQQAAGSVQPCGKPRTPRSPRAAWPARTPRLPRP